MAKVSKAESAVNAAIRSQGILYIKTVADAIGGGVVAPPEGYTVAQYLELIDFCIMEFTSRTLARRAKQVERLKQNKS